MDARHRILVVDDDADIRDLLGTYLQRNGLAVELAEDAPGMWSVLDRGGVDLVILDIMLRGDDGLDLCRNLRARSTIPIVMLTARGDDTDRIVGLEMGADDYLGKPFNPRELLARIRSVLRRSRTTAPAAAQPTGRRLRFAGGWILDPLSRDLRDPAGVVTPLGGSEYRLLVAFIDHANEVLSRDQLMDITTGRDATPFDRSIDVQVSRLRQRLRDDARSPQIIKTVRNEGYLLACTVDRVG
jgi:two-component system OmpR family response regulator